ncbi:hypothetical protein PI87_27675 [Ralstonia sp. A12]|nr:hypothetical protein PI87_27675 [Ralstonia sp. A12]
MNTSDAQVLLDAEEEINSGETRRALEMLRPLLEEGHPAALFLFVHFSVAGTETDAEFDARRLGILKRLTVWEFVERPLRVGSCRSRTGPHSAAAIGRLHEADSGASRRHHS